MQRKRKELYRRRGGTVKKERQELYRRRDRNCAEKRETGREPRNAGVETGNADRDMQELCVRD